MSEEKSAITMQRGSFIAAHATYHSEGILFSAG